MPLSKVPKSLVNKLTRTSKSKPIVAYMWVSTAQQGRSGLGVEGQREAIGRFVQAEGFEVVGEFVEVETGKGSDALDRRLQLAAALAAAKKLKYSVVVAKLDRLSRDVRLVSVLIANASRSLRPSWVPTPIRSCFCRSGRERAGAYFRSHNERSRRRQGRHSDQSLANDLGGRFF
jgi:Resolvase, N terminal domain